MRFVCFSLVLSLAVVTVSGQISVTSPNGQPIPVTYASAPCVPSSGSLFPIGTTVVSCPDLTVTVIDGSGPPIPPPSPGWTKALHPCPSNAQIRDFEFVTDTELWSACAVDGMRHSLDGGQTWATENGGLSGIVGNIVNVVNTPLGLYISLTGAVNSNQGAYRWNGAAWVKLTSLPPTPTYSVGRPIIDIVYHVQTSELIVLANPGSISAYASTDGLTFTLVKEHIHSGLGLAFFQDSQGRLWAGTESDGNWLSLDAGRNWSRIGTYVNGLAYGDAPNGYVLYAERANQYVYNGTWTHTLGIFYLDTVFQVAHDATRIYAAAHALNNPTTKPLYASSDNGLTFTAFGLNPPAGLQGWSVKVNSHGLVHVGAGDGWIYQVQ